MSGEEAIATAVCAHLRADDTVMSTHRGHGHALAKGVPPRELIAELLGKVTGCSHGRGGSMHLFKPEVGMLGTSGIVGPSILMAAGAGYTYMLKKSDQVAVAFFGDGAVSNGAFHEGLNLATVWDLPVLFVCENNQYATEVAFATITKNTSVASKAAAYGLPGIALDGNDVLAIHQAAGEAIAGRAPAAGRPCSNARPIARAPTPRGCATRATARRKRSRMAGARPDRATAGSSARGRASPATKRLARLTVRCRSSSPKRPSSPRNSPWPDAATATDHVFQ